MNQEILFCSCEEGDWVGLYIDDKLIQQGHSFNTYNIFETLKDEWINVNHNAWLHSVEFTNEEMDEMGNSFPDDIKNLVRRK